MSGFKRINEVYRKSPVISFDKSSKFAIISDCHRGLDDGADDFAKNQNAYYAALEHYYSNGFTYIELGDSDELWKSNDFNGILSTYGNIYRQLAKFYKHNRLYLVYGNHDIVKRKQKWVRAHLHEYYSDRLKKRVPLLPGIAVHEGLVLRQRPENNELLLLHGHQADFFNDALWPVSKFLVRHLWRPLELVGVKDPTSASKNHSKKYMIEEKLSAWTKSENKILIAGHTHRSMFPQPGKSAYFNDGCCVYPRHIMAIEIESGMVSLVKWSVKTCADYILCIKRDLVAGPEHISNYFSMSGKVAVSAAAE